jgi:hypothetical protein
MPRPLTPPTSRQFEGRDREVFERLNSTWMHGFSLGEATRHIPWLAALFYWPEYAELRVELSRLLLTIPEREGSYSHADREWVDIVLATHMSTNVVLRTHLPDALGAGVRLEAIEAVRGGRDEVLTDDERLLAVFCRQVVDGTVDDETYQTVETYMGTRATVEYAVFITCLWTTMRQMNALGQEEPSDAGIDALIADFKRGTRGIPTDWRQRAVGPWPEAPRAAAAQAS